MLVVAVTTLPWSNVVGHPHWDGVAWSPLRDPNANLSDTVLNVLLFVPFGWFGARALAGGKAAVGAFVVLLAVFLSLSAETVQLFSHHRYSSMTDVVANGCGAVLGVVFGRRAS